MHAGERSKMSGAGTRSGGGSLILGRVCGGAVCVWPCAWYRYLMPFFFLNLVFGLNEELILACLSRYHMLDNIYFILCSCGISCSSRRPRAKLALTPLLRRPNFLSVRRHPEPEKRTTASSHPRHPPSSLPSLLASPWPPSPTVVPGVCVINVNT